ncbi:MAG: tyrosine-type recombinase/integrase [Sphingobacteriaceae bacterium]|jgi:integrase|nr:tyrosine-type recombinase/integrase [Sphingobacteriaceae bacterium]
METYPLNPHCKPPLIAGKKLSDKWFVFFHYQMDGKRLMFRQFKGLNDPSQTITDRKKTANELVQKLDDQLKTHRFDTATKSFVPTVTESTLLAQLIDDYLLSVKDRLTKNTYANYTTVFSSFKILAGQLMANQASKELIRDFLWKLDIKPQSKRAYRAYLSAFFNWVIEEAKLAIINPTLGIKLPKNHPVERHRVYNKTDIATVIKYCDQKGHMVLKTIIYLIYGAQIRISEILRIQMKDFRLDENKIVLPKGKAKIKNKAKTVLIDQPLKKYLLELPIDFRNETYSERYFIGITKPLQKAGFCKELPLSKNTVDSRFKILKKDLKIEKNKTLYSFKHTGNVNLLISGADLVELMYRNGHSKVSQTETYARELLDQIPESKYIRKSRKDFNFH